MKNSTWKALIAVFVLVAVALGSFELGVYYQRTQRARLFSQFGGGGISGGFGDRGQMQSGAGGQQRMNGMPQGGFQNNRGSMYISGKVDVVRDDSITITTRFGSQKILLTSKTKVGKTMNASIKDIKAGSQIIIGGAGDPGKGLSAQNIYVVIP